MTDKVKINKMNQVNCGSILSAIVTSFLINTITDDIFPDFEKNFKGFVEKSIEHLEISFLQIDYSHIEIAVSNLKKQEFIHFSVEMQENQRIIINTKTNIDALKNKKH